MASGPASDAVAIGWDPYTVGVTLPYNWVYQGAGGKGSVVWGGPGASATSSTSSAPVSASIPLPDPSLAGQAWGWPIPITAGKRPGLPGRPVRRRLNKLAPGNFTVDALISFGWRAEVMARFDPATFDATKLLANGMDIWEKDVFTFPGGTVEIFDGLQLTAVWADIDGAEAQAYI